MTISTASPYTDVTNQIDKSDGNHVASLPYFPIYIASQFASTDESKGLINSVSVRNKGNNVEIVSTDGHRCFRFIFPSSNVYFSNYNQLFIDANQFKKKFNKKSHRLDLYANNYCEHISENHQQLDAQFNWYKFDQHTFHAGKFKTYGEYPNVDTIWHGVENNKLIKGIAFNADYLSSFCKVVSKFNDSKVVKFKHFTSPTAPCILSSDHNIEEFKESELEYLLMPVMVRDSAWNITKKDIEALK